jgi:hypothetical protein
MSGEPLDESRYSASLDTTISWIKNDLALGVIRTEIRGRSIRVQRVDVVFGNIRSQQIVELLAAGRRLGLKIVD